MKKHLLLFMAVMIFISGCTQSNKNETDSIHSYYDGNPVLTSEVNEFIKIKTMIREVEPDFEMTEKIDVDEIDSVYKCWDFIDYRQYDGFTKMRDFYLDMSKEEKEQDYYIALEKINYCTEIFVDEGKPGEIAEIIDYYRYIIIDNPEHTSNGVEIKNSLMDMAKEKRMTFEEYVEQYYLTVVLAMHLDMSTPVKYAKEEYNDEVPMYPDISLLTEGISDETLNEIAQDLDEYYSFIEIVSFDFYEYLLEQSKDKITKKAQ